MTIQCFRFAKPGSRGRDNKPFHVYARRGPNGWSLIGQSGLGEAWVNFTADGEYLRLACDRCASAALAGETFTNITGIPTKEM